MSPRKKCGLIVKHGACVNSESMGLRTCPICKIFSSASNTTLNAHMDQCLCVDKGQQPMSKPRLKVKTLVDIYATAKGCTLEDLDKRNGTKWSLVSSYSNQVVSDNKLKGKKRSVLLRVGNEEDDGIGPVYIDAKGQKLRILSEFKEKASDPSREHVEDVSEKKSSNECQGKRLGVKKHYKHCKLVSQSRKLTLPQGNASELRKQIQEYQRGYSEECKGMERSETPGPSQRMLTRSCLSRNEDEDSGRWESEMTQERELTTDYDVWDDNEETGKEVFLSSNPSVSSGDEDNYYEGWEETGNNKVDDDDDDDDDLIPIPGPPGSFLPSPWDMETDATENHVNSSVITCQFQSSHDRNSSVSAFSNFAAPETMISHVVAKARRMFLKIQHLGDQHPHMIQQHLDLLSKSVPKTTSVSNPVLRLMGKDLMVINQREGTSHGDSSLKPTSQFQHLSKTQQLSPPVHFLHGGY